MDYYQCICGAEEKSKILRLNNDVRVVLHTKSCIEFNIIADRNNHLVFGEFELDEHSKLLQDRDRKKAAFEEAQMRLEYYEDKQKLKKILDGKK